MLSSITVREFLSAYRSDAGWTEQQMKAYDKYTDGLYWAWENWEDEVTREFWNAGTKPVEPTEAFRVNYAENAEDEQLATVIEAFGL